MEKGSLLFSDRMAFEIDQEMVFFAWRGFSYFGFLFENWHGVNSLGGTFQTRDAELDDSLQDRFLVRQATAPARGKLEHLRVSHDMQKCTLSKVEPPMNFGIRQLRQAAAQRPMKATIFLREFLLH
jgi:hypothetical protein